MTPRTGVYPYDEDLACVLSEQFYCISNRDLLHTLIHEPLGKLRDDFHSGKGNEFVLRERFRRWIEVVEEHIGIWAPMPTWELLRDDENWCEEIGMMDAMFCDEAEWIIFGDDIDIAWDTLDKLTYSIWMDDDLERVVKLMLQLKPDIEELIVTTREMDAVYVVRSGKVEGCSIEVTDTMLSGLHMLPDLANCMEPGKHPTYVLPDDVVLAFAEQQRLNQQWEMEYEARKQQHREAAAR